ncbi:hypothetical protein H3C66_02815 [Patescibacteria group bacterium]|nr:hypothetical protein [Patescibacteria group bacterium]
MTIAQAHALMIGFGFESMGVGSVALDLPVWIGLPVMLIGGGLMLYATHKSYVR